MLGSIGLVAMAAAPLVQAEPMSRKAEANVVCQYSHSAPDDSVVYPGRPGIAMLHDFYGNQSTDAYSTSTSLLAAPDTTCDNGADSSAYWMPAMRLPDGSMVRPDSIKVYYNNQAWPSGKFFTLQAIPVGLQILAGNHMGSAPNPNILFGCDGQGWGAAIRTKCVPDPVKGTWLGVDIHFPSCWDGVNLAPMFMKGGRNNMAYPDAEGACPLSHPVRLPQLDLHTGYYVGHLVDTTPIQLSMDPTLDANGKVVSENWGSLYTEHADFVTGWQPQSSPYMVNYCFNKDLGCNKDTAYAYSEPTADATIMGGNEANTNFGSDAVLYVVNPTRTPYVTFEIPRGVENFPKGFTPAYRLRFFGGNVTNTIGRTIYFYKTSPDWEESTITSSNAPKCDTSKALGTIYANSVQQYYIADITEAVKSATAAGEHKLSICLKTGQGDTLTFSSREGDNKPVLGLYAVKAVAAAKP
jgi:hypothetical protein